MYENIPHFCNDADVRQIAMLAVVLGIALMGLVWMITDHIRSIRAHRAVVTQRLRRWDE